MPPPMASGTLQEEVASSRPLTIFGVEKGVPSGEVLGEAEQVTEVVKDAESAQAPIPLVVQDLRAT